MLCVRKKPRRFGRGTQGEGSRRDGARVMLVEDPTTDGGPKIEFATAITRSGAMVAKTLAVFYDDIFPDTPRRLAAAGCDYTILQLGGT
jgi:orotate phosphoribosyltransferase